LQALQAGLTEMECDPYVFVPGLIAISLEIGEKDLKRFHRQVEDRFNGEKFGYA